MDIAANNDEELQTGRGTRDRSRLTGALIAGFIVALAYGWSQSTGTESPPIVGKTQTTSARPLAITADAVWRWNLGPGEQAYVFDGNCRIRHGESERSTDRLMAVIRRRTTGWSAAILVLDKDRQSRHSIIELEDEPQLTAAWYRGRPEQIPAEITSLSLALQPSLEANQLPQLAFRDAIQSLDTTDSAEPVNFQDAVRQVQFEEIAQGMPLPQAMPIDTPPPTERALGDNGLQFIIGGTQSIQFLPRGAGGTTRIQNYSLPATNETAVVARGGATVMVRDVQAVLGDGTAMDLGTITISAETIVGWFPAFSGLFGGGMGSGVDGAAGAQQSDGELYIEGDIVFRQGERIIYADRMYYNIAGQYGTILEAEAITPIPEYEGFVRLKADVLQQISRGQFVGFGAAVTSSRIGVPRYWLQSDRVQFSDTPVDRIDPVTGRPFVDSVRSVSSSGNTVYVGGFPVLYWPTFSSNLERSSFYLTGLKIKNDSIFGTQVMADFDLFQVFGFDAPPRGVDWTLSTDYLSERGPALGTNLNYAVPGAFGVPGPVVGFLDAWAINDTGLDVLGSDRRNLVPERELRGRALWRHRHFLPNDFELIAELGLISDRNFLEQYLESEWDQDKDHDTELRLRKYYLNNMFDLHADVRVNEFFTDTNRLPQLDHYNIGSSWFGDFVNWSAHNKIGYSKLEIADAPTNPIEAAKFTTLPGEFEREGLVTSTRQELAAPFSAGIFKIVPFVSGEAGFWGEAADGQELTRLLGQAGIRGSLPAWALYPNVQSDLFNVRGLAHKVELRGEFFYADSSANLDELPLYDRLDDNAQEQFRRRLIFNTFGGLPLPARFDPRTYAFRQGMQRYVTAPSTEIADDLTMGRVGLHQRFQTKRGLPGRERIVDLVRFDVETIIFANEEEANFGETIGPTRYDFRYHVGDRVSLLSDGYFDFFDEGLRSISAGVMSSRPGLGDIYVGILSLEGPISSTVLRGQVDYRLNEKWAVSAGTTFDLGAIGNVGQQLAVTRIGESMLVQAGITVDAGRDNVGFQFLVEPRFLFTNRLGMFGGQRIPPPGLEGLE